MTKTTWQLDPNLIWLMATSEGRGFYIDRRSRPLIEPGANPGRLGLSFGSDVKKSTVYVMDNNYNRSVLGIPAEDGVPDPVCSKPAKKRGRPRKVSNEV